MVMDSLIIKQLIKSTFDIPLQVTYPNGNIETYNGSNPHVKLKLNKNFSVSELSKDPSIVLGEAVMDGDIEIYGSIQELILSAYRCGDSFLRNSKFSKLIPKQFHDKKHSKSDIQKHYDIGNDFYKLWLDDTMTYSCAYFKHENDSLEQAQLNKVHHILNKLNAQPGGKLLDIGCGWGTLIITAAKEYGLNATGITLSEEQASFITKRIKEEGLENKVTVLIKDYRDIRETYDYITSVGMFEHVGKENLSQYFQTISKRLNINGLALIHGITGQVGGNHGSGTNSWINKYIFPGGYIPRLTENLNHIASAGLQIADLEPLRRHYQKTLELWTKNFHNALPEVQKTHDKRFINMWDLYLQSCAASFESGNIDIFQYLLSKGVSKDTMPMTRDYMYSAN
ncbi:TPA: class I SAM-dependent methyltransferase [Streptococcus agalactiae]|jgi:cyclopropane-fatty-acyl-phospholipid synthase (EC 2.1.1.79)|uniref:Cyclopropane-fatty-acyl-phospholipid synthase n=4 Tax=Streptococcus agalactiae TaxID=1311 RepID=Q8DXU8_STRA5|nr:MULTISPECIES: cyclopropane-fatty-acyl-phospholipid synthase family protein [Streptococcus]EPW99240.1 cyclopropane-fatty-acyl-phospholipid synthase [Streptococcus agalactiae MRI Z1-049]HEO8207859.1 class I SAM-dependent methyltransferase [Streptococcus agalactiae ADL-350]AAN00611.1 cyclopropane-fatty-acyl-phospholipid synthase [Streptococcus agalactiae 2603V/R]AKU04254.1 cyclopropane-fatty-acyl-phospholipid synthase [Streptococcus agalactiae]AMD32967.1 cyclopropane-fatty-acyl-phospholipid sy